MSDQIREHLERPLLKLPTSGGPNRWKQLRSADNYLSPKRARSEAQGLTRVTTRIFEY
jgi:hypothetical protein